MLFVTKAKSELASPLKIAPLSTRESTQPTIEPQKLKTRADDHGYKKDDTDITR